MTKQSTLAIRAAFGDSLSYGHKDWKPINWAARHTTDARRILIAADLHIPRHDPEFVEAMLAVALDNDIEQIIWLGDLLDMEEFSFFGIDDPTSAFSRNVEYTGQLIKKVNALGFDQIWSRGNHEERITKATKGQIDLLGVAYACGLSDLINQEDTGANGTLVISEHPSVLGSVGNWLFTHPAQFGTPLSTANKLAQRERRNVACAHEHCLGLGRSEDDQYWVANVGGMFNPELHKYIQYRPTGHRAWSAGFLTVLDGKPRIYHRSDVLG